MFFLFKNQLFQSCGCVRIEPDGISSDRPGPGTAAAASFPAAGGRAKGLHSGRPPTAAERTRANALRRRSKSRRGRHIFSRHRPPHRLLPTDSIPLSMGEILASSRSHLAQILRSVFPLSEDRPCFMRLFPGSASQALFLETAWISRSASPGCRPYRFVSEIPTEIFEICGQMAKERGRAPGPAPRSGNSGSGIFWSTKAIPAGGKTGSLITIV